MTGECDTTDADSELFKLSTLKTGFEMLSCVILPPVRIAPELSQFQLVPPQVLCFENINSEPDSGSTDIPEAVETQVWRVMGH